MARPASVDQGRPSPGAKQPGPVRPEGEQRVIKKSRGEVAKAGKQAADNSKGPEIGALEQGGEGREQRHQEVVRFSYWLPHPKRERPAQLGKPGKATETTRNKNRLRFQDANVLPQRQSNIQILIQVT